MPTSEPPAVWLLVGPQELLLRRAAHGLLDELRAGAPGASLEVVELRSSELAAGPGGASGLPDLRTASLFGEPRALVLTEAQDLPAAAAAALLAELEGPPPDTALILLATSTARIRALAKRITGLGGKRDVTPPRDWEDAKWARLVADEFARHGSQAERSAIEAIVTHAGFDVPVIVEKVAQAAAAVPHGRVTATHVNAVVVGHGNRGSFAVADAMCDRDPARALVLLRGVLESGAHPVMVLGALAYRMRSLVAVAAGLEPKSVGLNVTAGQARRLRGVRRNFGPGELTAAFDALARADAQIKGGELPSVLLLERAVVAIATRAQPAAV